MRSALARACLAVIVGAVLFSPAGYAAEREVRVVDTAYKPDAIRIHAGDSVIWRWASQNASPHTVTALDGNFDSDRDCSDAAKCRAPGYAFVWKFSQPGIYAYRCKVHAVMLGRVEVTEARPQEPPPADPTTSPAPPPPPESRTGPQAGSPRSAPASPQSGPAGPPPSRPRMAAVPGMTYSRAPVAAPSPRGIAPAVAPPRDPLSVLPDARPPEAEGRPGAPAEPPVQLSVEVPPIQSAPRTGLVVGIAVATLLATAAVFSKVVLFGRPWS